MKRFILLGMLILSVLTLVSCAYRGNPYPKANLTEERWAASVDNNANRWARGADRWFLTGDPNVTETMHASAPDSAAISTMNVRVSEFNNINIDGPFQVQLFGTNERNSVYVYGPNAEVRQVSIEVRRGTLYIRAAKDGEASRHLSKVIVRVGVMNLNNLTHNGSGRVEGRQIRSNALTIHSRGTGNIYLAGDVNLKCITQSNTGCVNVFGAITPVLDIITSGSSGEVNVSGNVGIRRIQHQGNNDINIIGANTDSLRIKAEGSGKIGINGRANVREIIAKERTCVYIYSSVSNNISVYTSGQAKVGITGNTADLYVDAAGQSKFMGRSLCAMNAYVRAHDQAHINVTASVKIYAAATEGSSVYFFGTPDLMSQFLRENGTIIPVWFDGKPSCSVRHTMYYKDAVPSQSAPARSQWKKKRLANAKGDV